MEKGMFGLGNTLENGEDLEGVEEHVRTLKKKAEGLRKQIHDLTAQLRFLEEHTITGAERRVEELEKLLREDAGKE